MSRLARKVRQVALQQRLSHVAPSSLPQPPLTWCRGELREEVGAGEDMTIPETLVLSWGQWLCGE